MLIPLMFAAAITIPVPGGIAALAHALAIDPPDRGRCVAELARVVYSTSRTRELIAHFTSLRTPEPRDFVPLPLSHETWSNVVFRRRIAIEDLFVAVLSDRAASLLAYGLSALDDETLEFLEKHPATIAALYQRDAAVFAAFAPHLRIRGNRVVPPGGTAAIALWEAVLQERVSRPEAFVRALFSTRKGRLAYLYDVIGNLDESRALYALGLSIPDSGARLERFQALTHSITSAFPEWDPRKFPFTRPPHDLIAVLMRVRQPDVDAAALAADLLDEPVGRLDRLDQFAFSQRVFARQPIDSRDAVDSIRAFPHVAILMLTLERIGVQQPRVYAALARRAQDLNAATREGRNALVQFQAAVALVDRMRRVRTIDRLTAETLVEALATTSAAAWLDRDVRRALSAGVSSRLEDALLRALSGIPGSMPVRAVTWEGSEYVFDLIGSERARMQRFRDAQGGPSIDTALDLYRLATSSNGGSSSRAAKLADTLIADSLLAWAYAADWPEFARVIRNVARRHDFGFDHVRGLSRRRTAWAIAEPTQTAGVPWRLEGSILALDIALAPLGLRRVSAEQLVAPALSSTERYTFIESFGMMNPVRMDDDTQRAVAEAIQAGERKVASIARTEGAVDDVIRAVQMDGWRARALRWAVGNDRDRVASYFSMAELLRLGGGAHLDAAGWAMSARKVAGCLCAMASTTVDRMGFVGRPHLGLLGTTVNDLHLRVAVALNELQLPAALSKLVLSAAAQEFFDRVRPTDADDWLALARTAQTVSRERIEDYLAGLTARGPLVARR